MDTQSIKEYLKNNLTFTNTIVSDIYGDNPDQIVLNILLEGEVIASTCLYPMGQNGQILPYNE
jgi:hypothetical protein